MLKRVVGRGIAFVGRVAPNRVMRALFRAWLARVEGWPDPRAAMRELLELDAEVELAADRTAIRYDGGIHAKHRLTGYHDFFVERIRPGERVLDLGCGKGELAADIVRRADARVTGVDRDVAYLAFARERFALPGLELVEGDLLEHVPDGHYDVVVLSNVLEHIGPRVELLQRVAEQAQPDRFLIRVPVHARDWTVPLRLELGLPHFSDPTHEVEYDLEGFEAEMHAAGLRVESSQILWGEIWAEVRR